MEKQSHACQIGLTYIMHRSAHHGDISALARRAGFNARDIMALTAAARIAQEGNYPQHVGAVIVCRGEVVGIGHNDNKTDPNQKQYNRMYRKNFHCIDYHPHLDGIHAEISALKSIPWNLAHDMRWNKATLYIVRIAPGLRTGFGLARPCQACMHAIMDAGIRHIVYTTDDGIARETLND